MHREGRPGDRNTRLLKEHTYRDCESAGEEHTRRFTFTLAGNLGMQKYASDR
jgi:hypothetical protein